MLNQKSLFYRPSMETVEKMKQKYTPGTRIQLDYMDDEQAPKVGTKGTVTGVDDMGSIQVTWDTGSTLRLAYGEDVCHIIADEECVFQPSKQDHALNKRKEELIKDIPDGFAYYEFRGDALDWLYFNPEGGFDGQGSFESGTIYSYQIPFVQSKERFFDIVNNAATCYGVDYSNTETFIDSVEQWLSLKQRYEEHDNYVLSDDSKDLVEQIQIWSLQKSIDGVDHFDRFFACDSKLCERIGLSLKVAFRLPADAITKEELSCLFYKTDSSEDHQEELLILVQCLKKLGILASLADCKEFLWNHESWHTECLHINDGSTELTQYAFQFATEDYLYVVRINPCLGKENVIIYCYTKESIMAYRAEGANGIEIVDECGDQIVTVDSNSTCLLKRTGIGGVEAKSIELMYFDKYHIVVNDEVIHRYSFIDIVKSLGWTMLHVGYFVFPL